MKYKAVVFDMDGVIFDSERLVLSGWERAAKSYGLEGVGEVFLKCIGTNAVETKKIFLAHYGEAFPYDEFRKVGSAYFHEQCKDDLVPMKPGVAEILRYLNDAGYLVGLASSTRYEFVYREIKAAGLLPYFRNLTCGDMLKKSKPEPDIFLMACDSLGVRPEEAIAIEDSYNGIRAAYRAGMFPVMVPDLVMPDEEIRGIAGAVFENLTEVQNWIQNSRWE